MAVAFKEYRRGQRILFSDEGAYTAAAAALNERGFRAPYHGKNWFEDREQFPFYIWINAMADGSPLDSAGLKLIRSLVEAAWSESSDTDSSRPQISVTHPVDLDRKIREETQRIEKAIEARLTEIADSIRTIPLDLEARIAPQLSALAGDDEKLKSYISAHMDRSREKQLEEDAARLRKERDDNWDFAQHLDEERQRMESDIERLKSDNAQLLHHTEALKARLNNRDWQIPDKLMEMVQFLAATWPDRLVVTDSALDSARNAKLNDGASNIREVKKIWSLLQSIPTTLFELFFDLNLPDIDNQFKNRTGFELALTEGKRTKADSELMDERTVCVDGQEYQCTAHIKYDGGGARRLRVHFAVDHPNRRIVIAHCGDHLESAGTRHIR